MLLTRLLSETRESLSGVMDHWHARRTATQAASVLGTPEELAAARAAEATALHAHRELVLTLAEFHAILRRASLSADPDQGLTMAVGEAAADAVSRRIESWAKAAAVLDQKLGRLEAENGRLWKRVDQLGHRVEQLERTARLAGPPPLRVTGGDR